MIMLKIVGVYSGEMPIALYADHINLTFYEGKNEPYVMDIENFSYGSSAGGVYWFAVLLCCNTFVTHPLLLYTIGFV